MGYKRSTCECELICTSVASHELYHLLNRTVDKFKSEAIEKVIRAPEYALPKGVQK